MNALQTFIQSKLTELGALVPENILSAVIEELEYAIVPPIHEGAFPAYGAILANGPSTIESRIEDFRRARFFMLESSDEMKRISDGTRSFFCRHIQDGKPETQCVFVCEMFSIESEVALFTLRDEAVYKRQGLSPHTARSPEDDFMVVQRKHSGEVALLCSSGIVTIRGHQWTARIYQYDFGLEEMCARIVQSKGDPAVDVYRSLARLSLHILSARRVGATLIVEPTPDDLVNGQSPLLDSVRSIQLGEAKLSIKDRGHQLLIAHLLAHTDGAAVFHCNGILHSIQNWLSATHVIDSSVSLPGGTRQRSACAASWHVKLPIVTVSADGPVRVYSKGTLKMSTDISMPFRSGARAP